MSDARILVAADDKTAQVRVQGRATFAISQDLRDFGLQMIEEADLQRFLVDLSDCTTMDSTFMGVLAMIGVKGRARKMPVEIVNASDTSKKLLNGLGLRKLFVFSETEGDEVDWQTLSAARPDDRRQQQTILESHETLMEVDPENVPKFRDVVDFLKAGLEESGQTESRGEGQ